MRNNTIGSTIASCYNRVVVVTSTFCTETSDTVLNMRVVVERVILYQLSDFIKRFNLTVVH